MAPKRLGTMVIIPIKARNLPNKQKIGKQDPYCQLSYGSMSKKTKADKRGGQHPVWDEEFRFDIWEDLEEAMEEYGVSVDGKGGVGNTGSLDSHTARERRSGEELRRERNNRILKIACYADDARDPDLIGEGNLDLSPTLKKGEFDDWVAIKNKGKPCGEVYVEMTFYSNASPPPTRKKTPTPAINTASARQGQWTPLNASTIVPSKSSSPVRTSNEIPTSLRPRWSNAPVVQQEAPLPPPPSLFPAGGAHMTTANRRQSTHLGSAPISSGPPIPPPRRSSSSSHPSISDLTRPLSALSLEDKPLPPTQNNVGCTPPNWSVVPPPPQHRMSSPQPGSTLSAAPNAQSQYGHQTLAHSHSFESLNAYAGNDVTGGYKPGRPLPDPSLSHIAQGPPWSPTGPLPPSQSFGQGGQGGGSGQGFNVPYAPSQTPQPFAQTLPLQYPPSTFAQHPPIPSHQQSYPPPDSFQNSGPISQFQNGLPSQPSQLPNGPPPQLSQFQGGHHPQTSQFQSSAPQFVNSLPSSQFTMPPQPSQFVNGPPPQPSQFTNGPPQLAQFTNGPPPQPSQFMNGPPSQFPPFAAPPSTPAPYHPSTTSAPFIPPSSTPQPYYPPQSPTGSQSIFQSFPPPPQQQQAYPTQPNQTPPPHQQHTYPNPQFQQYPLPQSDFHGGVVSPPPPSQFAMHQNFQPGVQRPLPKPFHQQ